ncbi:MAG TPA: PAS domain-containing protein [Streptosporangiaceae bacterium]|nr:PAS domain-containing protein [Streptosporangiaceae bacterium]
MTAGQIDYKSVFQNLPTPVMLLSTDFRIIDTNIAHLGLSGKPREELIGALVFDAFPDNPAEPGVSGTSNLSESLRRVVDTGRPDTMALQRYDVEVPGKAGAYEERYWCPMNVPVRRPGGEVDYIIHMVEEVPALIRKFVDAESAGT